MESISNEYLKEQLIYMYPDMDISHTLDLVRNILQLRSHVANEYLKSEDYNAMHANAGAAIQFYNDEIKRLLGIL